MVQAGKVLLLEVIEPGDDGGEPRVLFPQLLGFVHCLLVPFSSAVSSAARVLSLAARAHSSKI